METFVRVHYMTRLKKPACMNTGFGSLEIGFILHPYIDFRHCDRTFCQTEPPVVHDNLRSNVAWVEVSPAETSDRIESWKCRIIMIFWSNVIIFGMIKYLGKFRLALGQLLFVSGWLLYCITVAESINSMRSRWAQKAETIIPDNYWSAQRFSVEIVGLWIEIHSDQELDPCWIREYSLGTNIEEDNHLSKFDYKLKCELDIYVLDYIVLDIR